MFNGTNGDRPVGKLVRSDGDIFYGVTAQGGTHGFIGYGTVFRITTNGLLTTLVSLAGTNGLYPMAGLVLGRDGDFYGVTGPGGLDNNGGLGAEVVFRMTPDGTFTNLYSAGGIGQTSGSLVEGNDGSFYGTTAFPDVVFKITTNGAFTTMAYFDGPNGSFPVAGLIRGTDGDFYGTTSGGGNNPYEVGNKGSVFGMSSNGDLRTLYSFTGYNDGGVPVAELLQGKDGNLYGTTSQGGSAHAGTIFRLNVAMPLVFQTVMQTNGSLVLTWNAVAGQTYQLQYNSDLTSTNWNDLGSTVAATNGLMTVSDAIGPDPQRFYRVVLLP